MADAYDIESDPLWESKIVKHTKEKPAQLLANPLNFRIHSALQQNTTVALLDQIGIVKSIQVNINTEHIVDGHNRVTLAMRKPGQLIDVEWLDLTEEEEQLALMGLDYIVGLAGIDGEKLHELSTAVPTDDLDFDLRDMVDAMIAEHAPVNGSDGMDLSQFSQVTGTAVAYRVVVDNLSLSDAEKLSEAIENAKVEQYRV